MEKEKLRLLKPLTNRIVNRKKIFGFDIETTQTDEMSERGLNFKKQKFYMGSVVGDDFKKVFYDKVKMQNFMTCSKILKDNLIFATNLDFDFNMLFDDFRDGENFFIIERNGRFISVIYRKYGHMWKYLDTLNFTLASVKKLGIMLNHPKKPTPKFIGQRPKNQEEENELLRYNINDSIISYKFGKFIQNFCNTMKCKMKVTIASTGMDFWRRNYQKQGIFQEKRYLIEKHFEGSIKGGRTENFKRGYFKDIFYYDFNCYSEDTELLTDSGFKKYNKINVNDRIYSMQNNKLVKEKIKNIYYYNYNGKMIRLKNENTDQLVTPNHRVYYKDYIISKRYCKNKRGWSGWKVKHAEDMPKTHVKFPNAFEYNCKGISIKRDMIKLLAWFITEGSHCKKLCVIGQSMTVNKKYCVQIIKILNSLNIKYKKRIQYRASKKYLIVWFNYDKYIKPYLGYDNQRSKNKCLPYNFMKYSLRQKKILFDELIKGDGHLSKGKCYYSSISNNLLDDFQVLSTMLGYKCQINYKFHYAGVKLNRNGESQICLRSGKSVEKYKGIVWCVTTKYKNIVVRRNGKVFISGNSMYPSVCKDGIDGHGAYPDPSSAKHLRDVNVDYIETIEGITHCQIEAPDVYIPLLGSHDKHGKLFFPKGKLTGWWTNVELRYANELGYKINNIDEMICYDRTFVPFKDCVKELYALRMSYKKEGNWPMEQLIKILMNSGLFGKFAQKINEKTNVYHIDSLFVDRDGSCYIKRNGKKVILAKFEQRGSYVFERIEVPMKIPVFILPILASYTTAMSRSKLHESMNRHPENIIYCDTDSMTVNRKIFDSSNSLGKLKLEAEIKEAIFCRPKQYFYSSKGKDTVKIKGVIKKVIPDYKSFMHVLETGQTKYDRFTKVKESAIRRIPYGSIIEVNKKISLEDDKRIWDGKFAFDRWQDSKALEMIDGVSELEYARIKR